MDRLDEIVLVGAPLERDIEVRRWYAHGGGASVVLSAEGKLLEPLPTFGPSCYVLIASGVRLSEANEYAYRHAYYHARSLN